MKQIVCSAALLLACSIGFAQSIDDVKKLIDKSDWGGAKKAIDGHLAESKNAAKAEGWFYKGVIYNEVSKKDDLKSLCTDCKGDAFEAFKKYQVMDPKNMLMVLEQNVRLFDLYNGYFDLASKAYSDKNFEAAYNYFKGAGIVEDYIRSKGFEYNGFKFSALDTSLTQNMALSARLANKEAEAVVEYQKLADIEMKGPENLEMYQYLANYYSKNKNKSAFDAIMEKGRRLYPTDEYWLEMELDQVDPKDKQALFAKYEEVLGKYPDKYSLAYNYAVELFNYMYVGDSKPADFEASKSKFEATANKAISLKNTPEANLIMARHIYNDVYDLQDALKKLKGNTPADAKKRVEMRNNGNKYADNCIKYAETAAGLYAAMPKLKPIEKANYKNALGIIESMYGYKGNTAKAAEAKKQADAIQ